MAKAISKVTRKFLRTSAIENTHKSGLELIPKRQRKGKMASMRDYAKAEFQPWLKEEGEPLGPNDDVMRMLGFWSRIANATMFKTKEQLMQTFSEMELADADKLVCGLVDTGEKLKGLAEMVHSAHTRFMIAAAARVTYGGVKSHNLRKA